MTRPNPELAERFAGAVRNLEFRIPSAPLRLDDANVNYELRDWLDKDAHPMEWTEPYPDVTADEWFFITTLYGQMTSAQQRVLIRKYFPTLFVGTAQRDIRNFHPDLTGFEGLRADWMKARLCKMGAVLRERGLTMAGYVTYLQTLETTATADDPTPALDAIVRDHQATAWKTLSVFVRDCVGGNCFPIDSRVEKGLKQRGLPVNERLMVRLALALGRNPRQMARMFYEAGGEAEQTERERSITDVPDLHRSGENAMPYIPDDNEAYCMWIESHPNGFVVNSHRRPAPSYLVLHHATCGHMQRRQGRILAGGDYAKICADTEQELHDWAATINGVLTRCGACKP